MSLRRARDPRSLPDGWRILIALGVAAVCGSIAAVLFLRDTGGDLDNYDSSTSDGNTAWILAAAAVLAVGYALWVVFTDAEEAVERTVRQHGDEMRDIERFEPRLFRWVLVAAVLLVVIGLLL